MNPRKLISFDWAIKRLLRSKANFGILEGFLSELLKTDIVISEILESETNQTDKFDKQARVDLKAKNSKGEYLIIELQFDSEYDYFQRILFGTSKVVTEHIRSGMTYSQVSKVISINILYFDLGAGDDYVYHGITEFTGIHSGQKLDLSPEQKLYLRKETVKDIFPEYYLLNVLRFDDIAKNSLDEWIYFLKNSEIREEFTAKGLKEAATRLNVMQLSEAEYKIYEKYEESKHYEASQAGKHKFDLEHAKFEGLAEGLEKGKAEGEKNALLQVALTCLSQAMSPESIATITGLALEEIISLKNNLKTN